MALLVAVMGSVAGCADSGNPSGPSSSVSKASPATETASSPAIVLTSAPYSLSTACGVVWAYFEGQNYKADPPLSDGHGNAPPGWKSPGETGTMWLFTDGTARFTDDAGHWVRFVPHKLPRFSGCD